MSTPPTLLLGDCFEVLQTLKAESVDACVTDPPYGLSFMGKHWDKGVPDVDMWRQVFRVLKPGAHLLSFFGTRTYHRGVVAIEDAGFEIRDQIGWLYGSGFPKSLDVSKAIDKAAPRVGMFDAFAAHFSERLRASGKAQKEVAALFPSRTGGLTGCVWNWANGANVPTLEQWKTLQPLLELSLEWLPLIERIEAEREVTGKHPNPAGSKGNTFPLDQECAITAPATEAAKQWDGWGTALKPAWEPIVVARKPFPGRTVAQNVLEHGVGGLNIDGCRVGTDDDLNGGAYSDNREVSTNEVYGEYKRLTPDQFQQPPGRWPANVIHSGDNEVLAEFAKYGERKTGNVKPYEEKGASWFTSHKVRDVNHSASTGTAARFFYTAKASKDDRNDGLYDYEHTDAADMVDREPDSAGMNSPRAGAGRTSGAKNQHPTVKPTSLMRYLVRLVCPKGGLVLDPFAGSGTTLIAAYREDCRAIGIELDPDYHKMASHRIDKATAQLRLEL